MWRNDKQCMFLFRLKNLALMTELHWRLLSYQWVPKTIKMILLSISICYKIIENKTMLWIVIDSCALNRIYTVVCRVIARRMAVCKDTVAFSVPIRLQRLVVVGYGWVLSSSSDIWRSYLYVSKQYPMFVQIGSGNAYVMASIAASSQPKYIQCT